MSKQLSLQDLVNHKKLTVGGRDWLKAALDPFHDTQLDLSGFPDINGGRSLVQMYQSSATISAPGANPYNARIWATGLDTHTTVPVYHAAVSILSDHLTPSNTSLGPYGFVQYEAFDNGINPNLTVAGATLTRGSLHNKANGFAGRMVACGIEVHNTTAEIYKQGTLTAGFIPNVNRTAERQFHNSTLIGWFHTQEIPSPPYTADTAVRVPGSVQWNASEGGYSVFRLTGANDVTMQAAKCAVWFENYTSNVASTVLSTDVNTVADSGADTFDALYVDAQFAFNDWSRPFLLFTGLSNETTLTVTVKAYYEYFPTYMDTALAPAVTPSPPYDELALKLYSMAAPQMPVCVPVRMNPLGEYYNMMLNVLQRAIPMATPIVSAFVPEALPVLGAANAVVNALPRAKQQPRRNKKKKNVPKLVKKGWGSVGGS